MDAGSVMPQLTDQAANLLFVVNQVFPMGHSQLETLSGINKNKTFFVSSFIYHLLNLDTRLVELQLLFAMMDTSSRCRVTTNLFVERMAAGDRAWELNFRCV